MGRATLRRAAAFACVLALNTTAFEGEAETTPAEPHYVSVPSTGGDVIVVPPDAAARKRSGPLPVSVFLHGMCDPPENECGYFASAFAKRGWLLCPRARLRCEGGGTMWHHVRKHETIEASVEAVAERYAGALDVGDRTLVGFSLGAIAAADIAARAPGRYRRVLLLGAKTHPRPAQWKAAGVARVLFAAGRRDMMHWVMVRDACRARRHLPSRFLGMGDVGHWFARDMDAWLGRALAWLWPEPGSTPKLRGTGWQCTSAS